MSRSIKLLVVMSLVIVAIVPVTALAATSLFVDVPDNSTFVNDINWMKVNGVTKGCNPPANTMYCPEANVTRQQMAAFMHRLAVNRVVDADKIDGMDSTALRSVAASASMGGTVGQAKTVLGSVIGFDVPAAGGGILATTTMSFAHIPAAPVPQAGILWIEIDGNGTCSAALLPGFAVWETITAPAASSTALASAAVPAGSHRVDICHQGVAATNNSMVGKVVVEWVPVVDTPPGLLEAEDAGPTVEELLAPFADLLDS
jgi:hypothetical protein